MVARRADLRASERAQAVSLGGSCRAQRRAAIRIAALLRGYKRFRRVAGQQPAGASIEGGDHRARSLGYGRIGLTARS